MNLKGAPSAGTRGRSLELYYVDGRPDGLVTAEIFNWTGHVLLVPRTQTSVALKREEASRTGVYILTGEEEGQRRLYIGEAEDVGERIKRHLEKAWWESVAIVTTTGDGLHKAHVKYLESRLVEIAKSAGEVVLENGNSPTRSSLSEAHVSNMESFLESLLIILPAVRIDSFIDRKRSSFDENDIKPEHKRPRFTLITPKNNIAATARLEDGEFVVEAGSDARDTWKGADHPTYRKLHSDLVKQGILVTGGDKNTFTTDYAFSSTTAAGAVINGRPTAGPREWKVEGTEKTYQQWEAEQIDWQDQ